jgi:nucleoside-diphosphate-sugar epimerase
MTQATTSQNVFITGADGALGRELTERLIAAGHKVTGAVTGSAAAGQLRAMGALPAYPNLLRAGELRSAMLAAQATVVVDAAPQLYNNVVQSGRTWDEATTLLETGTPALAEAAAAAGVQFVVHCGYALVYGDTHGHAVDETAKAGGSLPLVRAARKAEDAVLHGSVPGCVLRAGYLYSAYSPEMVALRESVKGKPLSLGGEKNLAGWVHAADLAQAAILALETRPAGEIINVVDDAPASPTTFARYFAESLGLPLPGRPPAFLDSLLGDKTHAALMNQSARPSNAKAKSLLGWTPHYSTYREGIDQTLLVWRADQAVR